METDEDRRERIKNALEGLWESFADAGIPLSAPVVDLITDLERELES